MLSFRWSSIIGSSNGGEMAVCSLVAMEAKLRLLPARRRGAGDNMRSWVSVRASRQWSVMSAGRAPIHMTRRVSKPTTTHVCGMCDISGLPDLVVASWSVPHVHAD